MALVAAPAREQRKNAMRGEYRSAIASQANTSVPAMKRKRCPGPTFRAWS